MVKGNNWIDFLTPGLAEVLIYAPVTWKTGPYGAGIAGIQWGLSAMFLPQQHPQCWVNAGLLFPCLNARESFYIYLPGFERSFQQGFNHKDGHLHRERLKYPWFPDPVGAVVTNDWCITSTECTYFCQYYYLTKFWPSWISGRGRMAIGIISWSVSMKDMWLGCGS